MTSIYSLTIFTSAFLLFLIQPMVSKILLPHLGGTPAVWNTSMVFFQTMLLLGYVYAHFSCKWLGVRRQAWLHGILLLLSLAWLPLAVKTDLVWVDTNRPIAWIIVSLTLSLGVPFFLLAANAPLIQSWLSHTKHKDAANPYFLYSASNIGSMLALFAFPLLAEPILTSLQQTRLWSALYVSFIVCLGGCAWLMVRHYAAVSAPVENKFETAPTAIDRIRWIVLSFFPSSLLLGVTTFITTDIASAPLFWVLPLAIYLLTFIFAFARNSNMYTRALNAQIVLVPLTVLAIIYNINMMPALLLHLFTFFAIAMGCHGRLAQVKPGAQHLTEFYVCLSIGGMLGGMFNSLAAPQLFSEAIEYPLIVMLSLLARPLLSVDSKREFRLDFIIPAASAALIIVAFMAFKHLLTSSISTQFMGVALYLFIMATIYYSYKRPIRFTLIIVLLFITLPIVSGTGDAKKSASLLFTERNFFGVNRVFQWDLKDMMLLKHGTTIHGIQSLSEKDKLQLGSYYGVMRDVMHLLPERFRREPIGLIGLGAGTLACIGSKNQRFDFYEIDPAVAAIARNVNYFTYLRDCPPESSITLGDGRLEIAKAKDGQYGLIIVDAFTSDAIPLHLLTREALAIYRSKLSKGGLVAFNISNRYLNLEPVMTEMAKDANLIAYIKSNMKPANHLEVASVWVMMSSDATTLEAIGVKDPLWKPLASANDFSVWTDDYSNIMQTFF